MARRKPKRPTRPRRASARRAKPRGSRRAAKPVRRKASRRPSPSKIRKVARKPVRTKRVKTVKPARPVRPALARAAVTSPRRPVPRAALDRERRRLADVERLGPPAIDLEQTTRSTLAVKAGREELRQQLANHTETSPVMTAGDLDAKWEDAYAVGDEAPGGDNPTPDQDRVDDIGRALGVTYSDTEELRGSDKVAERDRHRWELDPASSDDWPHDPDKG